MPYATQRSPWHGLTSGQALELSDALTRPGADPDFVLAQVQEEYALRTVQLLVGNDLRGALHAAEIAAACLRLGAARDSSALRHPSDSGAEGLERSRSRVAVGDRAATASAALDGRERRAIVAARTAAGGEIPARLSHVVVARWEGASS